MIVRALHLSASEAPRPNAATIEADTFGFAQYLADAVLSGTVTLKAGADALAEWADHDDKVLTGIASRMPRGDSARHLLRVATEHHAA